MVTDSIRNPFLSIWINYMDKFKQHPLLKIHKNYSTEITCNVFQFTGKARKERNDMTFV